MLATTTKHQESAALAILCDDYLARGGKIITFANMSTAIKCRRRLAGLATPRVWDQNAREQFHKDDVEYYHIAEARNSLPVYDSEIGHVYGFADNDRRQSKSRLGGQAH